MAKLALASTLLTFFLLSVSMTVLNKMLLEKVRVPCLLYTYTKSYRLGCLTRSLLYMQSFPGPELRC